MPEVMVARHCGIRCFGLSLVTNMCVMDYEDNNHVPDHAEILETGESQTENIKTFFSALVSAIQLTED